MDQYVTGTAIRTLRENRKLTQLQLAGKLNVSDKTVSRWETGKGYPDITLLEPLASALGVSVTELLSGRAVRNTNVSGNMRRMAFYVCPLCGNILQSMGQAAISCHGVTLPPLEAETPDDAHAVAVEAVEDEYYVSVRHPMDREHYISFFALVTDDRLQLVKCYPEWAGAARFKRSGGSLYWYCNRDGLFTQKL